jgi:hypothetical protein
VEEEGLTSTAQYSVFPSDASPTCNQGLCSVELNGASGQITELGVSFEQSPTRMLLGGYYGHWFVPLGD